MLDHWWAAQSEGDPEMLLIHFSGVQWCQFWFNDSSYAGHPLLCLLLRIMLAKSGRVNIPSREQTATMSLCQYPQCGLWQWRLWSELPRWEGGRNAKTGVTMRAWHGGLEKLRYLFYAVIDENESWFCNGGGPISVWDYLTGLQTKLTVNSRNYLGVRLAQEWWHL